MRTSSKIVALMAAQSNAFFTELFSSETVETTKPSASFSESLYSAQDFVTYNWYDGYYVPFSYDGSYDGEMEGPYGGDVTGYIDYSVDGAYWYLDGVYAVGLYAYYVSAVEGGEYGIYYGAFGYGGGVLGAIYVPSYDYWYLGSYGGSAGYLLASYDGYWEDYYAFLAGYQYGAVYYLSYWGAGWLGAGNYGGAFYGYGDYDGIVGLYYYGYAEAYYLLAGLYFAYYLGYGYAYAWPFDYAGEYSYWYYGVEFSGPYYVYGGSYYFYYDTWAVTSWWGVSGGYIYGYYGDDLAALGGYSYWYGAWLWSWYYDASLSLEYGLDYTWGGYYAGDDYTGFALYLVQGYSDIEYDDSSLGGIQWYGTIGYASSEIEVSYWIEYFATDLIEYYYMSM